MNENLNPLQLLVAQHYDEGVHADVADTNGVAACGDALFELLITEAAECSGPYDYTAQLRRTADELRALIDIFETL